MKRNKAPGLDGLTFEFYKQFWPHIGPLLIDVFNESYDLKHLPESLRIAVMALIFKKGDMEDLENYRPISLISCMGKIYADVIIGAIIQKIIG